MGWFSKIIVGAIVLWAIYTFHSIFRMVQISEPLPGEIVLTNGIKVRNKNEVSSFYTFLILCRFQNEQKFDVHLYVTSDIDLRMNSFNLLRDPNISDRITPSLNHKLCSAKTQDSTFHLISFRTQYQFHQHGLFSYFRQSSSNIDSISTCDYQIPNPTLTHQSTITSQSNLHFILPPQLSKSVFNFSLIAIMFTSLCRRNVPLYLLSFGTRMLTADEQQHNRVLSFNKVALFNPTIERLTTILTPGD